MSNHYSAEISSSEKVISTELLARIVKSFVISSIAAKHMVKTISRTLHNVYYLTEYMVALALRIMRSCSVSKPLSVLGESVANSSVRGNDSINVNVMSMKHIWSVDTMCLLPRCYIRHIWHNLVYHFVGNSKDLAVTECWLLYEYDNQYS